MTVVVLCVVSDADDSVQLVCQVLVFLSYFHSVYIRLLQVSSVAAGAHWEVHLHAGPAAPLPHHTALLVLLGAAGG